MLRPMRFASLLLAAVALASCTGDDPLIGATGAQTDGDAGAALPLVDQWHYSTAEFPGNAASCVAATDKAVKAMRGSYAVTTSTERDARAAARPGAALYAFCVANGAGSLVVTGALGLEGALDAQNDDARLLALVTGNGAAPPASAPSSLADLRTADVAGVPKTGLTQALCQARAKVALDTVFADAAGTWGELGGAFLAIGGKPGTTAAVTCLALDLRAVVVNVATVDPAVEPAAVVDAVRAELQKLGAL